MAGSDLFTGSLELLILKSLSWGPMHGYGVARWLRDSAGETLEFHEGVVYPALHRLERKGLLEEEWATTDANRQAKYYHLTAAGRAQLRHDTARWRAYVKVMSSALATRRAPA